MSCVEIVFFAGHEINLYLVVPKYFPKHFYYCQREHDKSESQEKEKRKEMQETEGCPELKT